eukprot:1602535-Pyramimonas_sp.AAC.1
MEVRGRRSGDSHPKRRALPGRFHMRARPICVGRSQADARARCWAGRRHTSVQTETANKTH